MNMFDAAVRRGLPVVPKKAVWQVAKRYVAGTHLDDAVETVRRLNSEGAMATLDVLGESVERREPATEAVDEYLRALDRIAEEGLDCNVSLKLTQLGLAIDERFCLDNVATIAERAAGLGNFVRIDMEDHPWTDATLAIYRETQERFGNVGTVLQSYMRRTLDDIRDLAPMTPNIRLCKGIYVEPYEVAWRGFETVRANFVWALEALLDGGSYVGIATHDEHLVWAGEKAVSERGLDRGAYEFQMLLGVEERLRRVLIERGHRLRVYVPYGTEWHAYSTRRLRENPAVARNVVKAMLRRDR